MKGFSKIFLIAILVIGGGYYALITYYFGGSGEIVENDYGFEYKSDYPLEELVIYFNFLAKTVKEACDIEGIEKKDWVTEYDCGSSRDYSQEDLANWKQWIEKGILNHPDRYTKYTVMDESIGIRLTETDDPEFIDRVAKLKESIVEEKIINVRGRRAVKRIYYAPGSPGVDMQLMIFDNSDLIILTDNFTIWKGIAPNGKDLGELSREEIKNHPQNILFDQIISTFRFTK